MSEKAPNQTKQERKSSTKKEKLPKSLINDLLALDYSIEEIQEMKKDEAEDIVRIQNASKKEFPENVEKIEQNEQEKENSPKQTNIVTKTEAEELPVETNAEVPAADTEQKLVITEVKASKKKNSKVSTTAKTNPSKSRKEAVEEMDPVQELERAQQAYYRQAEVEKYSTPEKKRSLARRVMFWKKLDEEEEKAASPAYAEAKEKYETALKRYEEHKISAKESELRAQKKSTKEIEDELAFYKQFGLFDEMREKRKQGLHREVMKYAPERKNLFAGGMEWYNNLNRPSKIAISSAFITIGALGYGVIAAPAAGAYFGGRLARALLGAGVGQGAMAIMRKVWKDPRMTLEEKIEATKEKLAADPSMDIKEARAEVDAMKRQIRNASYLRSGVIGLTGLATGISASTALNVFFGENIDAAVKAMEKTAGAGGSLIAAEYEKMNARGGVRIADTSSKLETLGTESETEQQVFEKPTLAEIDDMENKLERIDFEKEQKLPPVSIKLDPFLKDSGLTAEHKELEFGDTPEMEERFKFTETSDRSNTEAIASEASPEDALPEKSSEIEESIQTEGPAHEITEAAGIPKEAIIGTDKSNWGVTQVLKQQLEADDELAKQLGYDQDASETAKANYFLKLGKQLGYINEDGSEVRIADTAKPAAYVLSAENGKAVVTEYVDNAAGETHVAGSAFENGQTESHEEIWKKPSVRSTIDMQEPGTATLTRLGEAPWGTDNATYQRMLAIYGKTSMEQIMDSSSNALEGYPHIRELLAGNSSNLEPYDNETLNEYAKRYEVWLSDDANAAKEAAVAKNLEQWKNIARITGGHAAETAPAFNIPETYTGMEMAAVTDTSYNSGIPENWQKTLLELDSRYPFVEGETVGEYLERIANEHPDTIKNISDAAEQSGKMPPDSFLNQEEVAPKSAAQYDSAADAQRAYEFSKYGISENVQYWNDVKGQSAGEFMEKTADANAGSDSFKVREYMKALMNETGLKPETLINPDGTLHKETVEEFIKRATEQKVDEVLSDAALHELKKDLRQYFPKRTFLFGSSGMGSPDWAIAGKADALHFLTDQVETNFENVPQNYQALYNTTTMNNLNVLSSAGPSEAGTASILRAFSEKFPPLSGETVGEYLTRRGEFISQMKALAAQSGMSPEEIKAMNTAAFLEKSMKTVMAKSFDPRLMQA